jgi:hypothetical protein
VLTALSWALPPELMVRPPGPEIVPASPSITLDPSTTSGPFAVVASDWAVTKYGDHDSRPLVRS